MKIKNKTARIAYTGLFTALSLIFSYVEFLFPLPLPVPGFKLGLSNLVIMVSLYILGPLLTLFVGLLKVTLSFLLFGNITSLFFSLGGFAFSYLTVFLLFKSRKFSVIGISAAGAVMHDLGQIIVSIFILDSFSLFYYMPVLSLTGLITGLLIGFLSKLIIERLNKNDRIY